MLEITAKANELVKKYNMLSFGDFVVVGVSGGADSMALLNYLIEKRNELNLRLLVANVEHGIRGQESVDDSAFVEEYCKNNGVEFKCLKINAVEEAKDCGMGVEEYSRERRYAFFHSFNPDKIATAHNLSDNVETVLFRMSRGTSIKGLCGIPAVRGNIIRPLLTCTSQEIREACKKDGIPFRIDSTNSDNAYSRNYIRNNIIPAFKELNPSFEAVVSRMIESVNEDEDFIEKASNKCFDECYSRDSLNLSKLRKYEASIIKRAIIKFADIYGLSLDDCHLNGVYALVNNTGRCQIKQNYFAISDKNRLRIAVYNEQLDFEDIVINKKIISRQDFLEDIEQLRKEFDFYCDYDKICGDITIRGRDEGDTISPANRDCTKSLKKLYNELHINVEDRNNIPIICDEKGIIGIYGYCVDERVKIDNMTQSVVLIKILLED